MPNKSYRNAVKEAIELEMRRDPTVVVMGEDVRGGHGGKNTEENKIEGFGGVLGVTKGLWTEFGSERVIDTPITESAIIGMAAGAAATGLRPVADLMFMDFYGVCHDMLYNQAAKFRYMFGGKAKVPLVIRLLIGRGWGQGPQHSQTLHSIFAHTCCLNYLCGCVLINLASRVRRKLILQRAYNVFYCFHVDYDRLSNKDSACGGHLRPMARTVR